MLWANAKLLISSGRSNYAVNGDVSWKDGTPPAASAVSGSVTRSTYTIVQSSEPSAGYTTTDNENTTGVSPSSAYDSTTRNVGVAAGSTATLTSGIYYFNDISSTGTLQLNITRGPVVIFMTGNLSITGKFLNATGIPANLVILGPQSGANTYAISSSDKFHGVIEAPTASITVNSEIYGAVSGDEITFNTSGKLHQDLSLQRARVNAIRIIANTRSNLLKRY